MATIESSFDLELQIEEAVLAVCHKCPVQTFSDIAKALPDYSWRLLFIVLHRLEKGNRIELIPYRWDYEIISETMTVAQLPYERSGLGPVACSSP